LWRAAERRAKPTARTQREVIGALCVTEPTTIAGAATLLSYLIKDEADHLEAVAPFVRGVNSCIAALEKISASKSILPSAA
jgi:hypothetical protein